MMARSVVCCLLVAACSGRSAEAPAPHAAATTPTPTQTPTTGADAGAGAEAEAEQDHRQETIELAFAGDVMFGRYVKSGFRAIPAETQDIFEHVTGLLDSDFTMVNLETPVMRDPPGKSPYGTRMRFVTTPARVASLKAAGVDGVTLANNHAYDMHAKGLAQTPVILDELGLFHVGASRSAAPIFRVESVEVGGWRVGFIAAAAVANWGPTGDVGGLPYVPLPGLRGALVPVIEAARADHDLLIVQVHWGTEYADQPDRLQVTTGRALIDAGADAVIGHHPHVIQGIERHGDGLIAYSLGNFVFDNLHTTKRLHGILRLRFRRDDTCLAGAVYTPTVGSRPYYRPRPAGKEFNKVAGRMRKLSKSEPLHRTDWQIDGKTLVLPGACAPDP